ncbi:hypothetical protein R3P38DRAFT_3183720 [Favolaschia claudopus]|uniref:Uncharacterized protein n=1 Tax=Favolaschia claudopus TaxID=2862362 RepID=A0AAW0CDI4_9AGAR
MAIYSSLTFLRDDRNELKAGSSFPYELNDLILSLSIAQVIHENVEALVHASTIPVSLHSTRSTFVSLAGVSSTFRGIFLKRVALAFGITLPCESALYEANDQFRSLLLFKVATVARAVITPPLQTWSPFMRAYGYYFRARYLERGRQSHLCESDINSALTLCKATFEGLTPLLLNALNSQLKDGVSYISFNQPREVVDM